jgi:hypothetical protein
MGRIAFLLFVLVPIALAQTPPGAYSATPPLSAAGGSGITSVSSIPSTCIPGTTQPVNLTSSPYGIYSCMATNTWAQGSSTALQSPILSPAILQWGNSVNVVDQTYGGPNPYVDVRTYGVRAVNAATTPAAVGLTASCTSSSNVVTVSAASTFVNGDGVVLYGCGAPHAMATPAAPIVTPSIAASSTGTGFVVTAPAGALTKCYKIAARDTAQGLTAASAEVCTNTGNTLGSQNVSISTISRSNATVTVTTSSAHGLAVGAMVYQKATSDTINFDGWFTVATVPDNTHYTYTSALDSRNGAGVSATGGTLYWFNCNHVVLPAPGAGVYEFVIWSGASGAETLIDVSMPAISQLSSDPTYMVWDDYGSPMMDGVSLPAFIPNTPTGSATSDSLVTTILSGAGTTTLTLGANAGTTIAGRTIRLDNTPNIVTALTMIKNTTAGMLYFPSVLGLSYVTNSFLDLSSFNNIGVSQAGVISLGDTLKVSGVQWHGDLTPNNMVMPSFGIYSGVGINVASAKPGIWATANVNFSGINMNSTGNLSNGFLLSPGSIPTATFSNMNFISSGAGDYMGTPFSAFAQFAAGGAAGIKFTNVLFSTGPAQVDGSTATQAVVIKNYGEVTISGMFLNRRGLFIDPNQAGQTLDVDMQYEEQGGITPMFTFTCGGGGCGGWAKLRNMIIDTMSHPLAANLRFPAGFAITVDGSNAPSSGVPLLSGLPFPNAQINNFLTTGTGQNLYENQSMNGLILDGFYAPTPLSGAVLLQNSHVALGAGLSLFTNTAAPAAPTCSVATAGPPFTPAGSFTFAYAVAYLPNNGVGLLSPRSGTCVSDGTTQQITINIPSAITGATGYTIWGNTMLTCSSPTTTTLSYLWTAAACGPSTPNLPGGGPAGISGINVWGQSFQFSPNTFSTLGTPRNGTLLYCPDCTAANPCASGGTGAFAKRLNGVWVCN